MGAIAEAFVAFAQPLLDQTDGSHEQMNKAFAMSQMCYNLSLFPEEDREKTLSEMRRSSGMDDKEFDEFHREPRHPHDPATRGDVSVFARPGFPLTFRKMISRRGRNRSWRSAPKIPCKRPVCAVPL